MSSTKTVTGSTAMDNLKLNDFFMGDNGRVILSLGSLEMELNRQNCQALCVVDRRRDAALEALLFSMGKKAGWCS